ncbi:hypothetical protein STEG23_012775 [Scotinomys teguina]
MRGSGTVKCTVNEKLGGLEVPSKELIYMMLEICKRKLLMNERCETSVFEVTRKMAMKTGQEDQWKTT